MSLSIIFPEFNRYSLPLLILVVQGYVFAGFLIHRYVKKKHIADLILASLLIITSYHRTTYTIGFMGWYDTFRNTKINYFLIDLMLAFGPLIYFYVKSITQAKFTFKKIDWLHFILPIVFVLYKISLYIHDSKQAGFSEVQNGQWLENIHYAYVTPFHDVVSRFSFVIYMVLSVQMFYAYRQKIKQFFSNTYKVQLNWLRNFLIAFCLMMVVQLIIFQIHNNIVELHWTQRWWSHFISALILLYLGTFGYFTDLSELYQRTTNATEYIDVEETTPNPSKNEVKPAFLYKEEKEKIAAFMETKQPYLNPELTLPEFAKELNLATNVVSKTINQGFEMNFKDFVNSYRVKNVQQAIEAGKANELSLLGIALEAGFNSKATFNRTFKKLSGVSPSEYLGQISNTKNLSTNS